MHWIYCLLEYKSQLQHLFLLLFRVCLTLRMSCVFCSISCTENSHTHIGGIEAKMAKQMSYTTGFKLKVIELAIKNGNKCWKRVWGERKASAWLEEKENRAGKSTLSSLMATTRSKGTLARIWKQALWLGVGEENEWIGISGTMIWLKVKSMAKGMLSEDVEGFTGCMLRLYRFMKQKNLVLRQKTKSTCSDFHKNLKIKSSAFKECGRIWHATNWEHGWNTN